MSDEKKAYIEQTAQRVAGEGAEMLLAMHIVTGFNAVYHSLMAAGNKEMAELVDDLSQRTVAASAIPIEVWERAVDTCRRVMEGARMLDDDPMPPAAGGVQ